MNILKYIKALGIILIPIIILNIIVSILYYFNIISDNIINYLNLFIISISMLIGGVYIGSKTSKKGYLEGLKIGLGVIFILFIVSYLAYKSSLSIKTVIYYFILTISSILGSMIGINKRKNTN